MRKALATSSVEGQVLLAVWGTGVLVDALLEQGCRWRRAEARGAVDRLAGLPDDVAGGGSRHLAAEAKRAAGPSPGDDAAYRDYRDRYRAMATVLGFEGHMQWAEAMP